VETNGRLLANRYELLGVLASGGMGRVWRARDVLLNRSVAVKVLRSEFTGDPSFVSRFRAEAQHAAVLHHPNIAAVFDYGEIDEQGERLAYLVMELVEGESLSTLLAREPRLDVPGTLNILRQTSAALAAAHAAGVIHRDVKPGNVLVTPDGVVKIADFGIAWSASSVPLTQTGQVIGTAHYLSPEQAAGGKATPASDVYALGTVAYECLAGRRAFEGENSVQIALKQIREEPDPLPADLPAGVRGLVERAMAKDPARRFADGAALQRAVESVLAAPATGTVPIAVPTGPHATAVLPLSALPGGAAAPQASAPAGNGRRVAARVLLGALAVLAVLALVGVLLRGSPDEAEQPGTDGTTEQTTAPTTGPPTATTPSTVDVVAAELVGRPVQEVQAELIARGLQVALQPVETGDVPAGQVTAVDPAGSLPLTQAVTVSYAVAPVVVEPPAENGKGNEGHGNGKGNGKKDD
jgi:serine/threonine-protein kinase